MSQSEKITTIINKLQYPHHRPQKWQKSRPSPTWPVCYTSHRNLRTTALTNYDHRINYSLTYNRPDLAGKGSQRHLPLAYQTGNLLLVPPEFKQWFDQHRQTSSNKAFSPTTWSSFNRGTSDFDVIRGATCFQQVFGNNSTGCYRASRPDYLIIVLKYDKC